VDLAGFEQLLSRAGQRLLEAAMTSYGELDSLQLNERLRRRDNAPPAELVAAAITQASLRRAAAAKFGADADRMYFTPTGLEQATHPMVARHRAARAGVVGTAGRPTMLDLGCGVGSDLLAFARAGYLATGVDVDPVTAAVARANLTAFQVSGTIRVARAEDVDRDGYDVVYVDPARRRGSSRVFDPRAFSPHWDFVTRLLDDAAARRGTGFAAVAKLAPGLDHALIPPYAEAEWVSVDGELKEAVLWSPPPARASRSPQDGPPASTGDVRRRATVLGTDGTYAGCTNLDAPDEPATVAPVGEYVYEPDDAVIRAHLVSAVAQSVGGWLLDPHIAYVSSNRLVKTPLARGFRVVDALPFREKALRSALRSRGIGSLTIKKRGVAVTPEELRRRLALRGPARATLLLSRTPQSAVALLVEPLQ
jgi:hypothetical protein